MNWRLWNFWKQNIYKGLNNSGSKHEKRDKNLIKSFITEIKQSRFGFMIIALTYKELKSCHFCAFNKKKNLEKQRLGYMRELSWQGKCPSQSLEI